MTPIYILTRTPGARTGETADWEVICHSREPFIAISFSNTTNRPFEVTRYSRFRSGILHSQSGRYKTLENAISAAKSDRWQWSV